ncbi:MAG: hypothetical protein ACJAWW_002406 [Sulfurimonas sp.]|jgi:hypothetical protein
MKKILIFALCVGLFTGCAKKVQEPKPIVYVPVVKEKINYFPFMSEMISQYNLDESDLLGLQFYISNDIILKKKSKKLDSKIAEGALIIKNDINSDEVVIKALTLCTLVKLEKNTIQVRFEDENYKLTFKNSVQDNIDKYFLSADSWHNKKGLLRTNNALYEAIGTSGEAYLMINLKMSDYVKNHKEILEGRSFNKSMDTSSQPNPFYPSSTTPTKTTY